MLRSRKILSTVVVPRSLPLATRGFFVEQTVRTMAKPRTIRHFSSLQPRPILEEEEEDNLMMDDTVRVEEWSVQKESLRKLLHKSRPQQTTVDHEENVVANAKRENVSESESPTMLTYTGNTSMPITSRLRLVRPGEDPPRGTWPVFRMMVSQSFRALRNGFLFMPACH